MKSYVAVSAIFYHLLLCYTSGGTGNDKAFGNRKHCSHAAMKPTRNSRFHWNIFWRARICSLLFLDEHLGDSEVPEVPDAICISVT